MSPRTQVMQDLLYRVGYLERLLGVKWPREEEPPGTDDRAEALQGQTEASPQRLFACSDSAVFFEAPSQHKSVPEPPGTPQLPSALEDHPTAAFSAATPSPRQPKRRRVAASPSRTQAAARDVRLDSPGNSGKTTPRRPLPAAAPAAVPPTLCSDRGAAPSCGGGTAKPRHRKRRMTSKKSLVPAQPFQGVCGGLGGAAAAGAEAEQPSASTTGVPVRQGIGSDDPKVREGSARSSEEEWPAALGSGRAAKGSAEHPTAAAARASGGAGTQPSVQRTRRSEEAAPAAKAEDSNDAGGQPFARVSEECPSSKSRACSLANAVDQQAFEPSGTRSPKTQSDGAASKEEQPFARVCAAGSEEGPFAAKATQPSFDSRARESAGVPIAAKSHASGAASTVPIYRVGSISDMQAESVREALSPEKALDPINLAAQSEEVPALLWRSDGAGWPTVPSRWCDDKLPASPMTCHVDPTRREGSNSEKQLEVAQKNSPEDTRGEGVPALLWRGDRVGWATPPGMGEVAAAANAPDGAGSKQDRGISWNVSVDGVPNRTCTNAQAEREADHLNSAHFSGISWNTLPAERVNSDVNHGCGNWQASASDPSPQSAASPERSELVPPSGSLQHAEVLEAGATSPLAVPAEKSEPDLSTRGCAELAEAGKRGERNSSPQHTEPPTASDQHPNALPTVRSDRRSLYPSPGSPSCLVQAEGGERGPKLNHGSPQHADPRETKAPNPNPHLLLLTEINERLSLPNPGSPPCIVTSEGGQKPNRDIPQHADIRETRAQNSNQQPIQPPARKERLSLPKPGSPLRRVPAEGGDRGQTLSRGSPQHADIRETRPQNPNSHPALPANSGGARDPPRHPRFSPRSKRTPRPDRASEDTGCTTPQAAPSSASAAPSPSPSATAGPSTPGSGRSAAAGVGSAAEKAPRPGDSQEGKAECPICFAPLSPGKRAATVFRLRCGHSFHTQCLAKAHTSRHVGGGLCGACAMPIGHAELRSVQRAAWALRAARLLGADARRRTLPSSSSERASVRDLFEADLAPPQPGPQSGAAERAAKKRGGLVRLDANALPKPQPRMLAPPRAANPDYTMSQFDRLLEYPVVERRPKTRARLPA